MENSIIQGDCIQVLKTLPNECVDLVVTDPPYLVRYRDSHGRSIANDDKPENVLGAFNDVSRVMKPNTFCICFYGWNRVNQFFRAWLNAGLHPVGHIVWQKHYCSRRSFLNAHHEMAYLLAKGNPTKPAHPLDDVQPWEYSGNTLHPTQKAVSVVKPLIEAFSKPHDVVLDPFAGSGSTLIAAALAGRRYIGIELEAQYCELIHRRMERVTRFIDLPRTA